MNWPFLVIQSKQATGNLDDACNQAARDGAAIVHAARELYKIAGVAMDSPGPDGKTYIYSAVMDTKVMEWYVHWAFVKDNGKVHYHMDTIVDNRLLTGEGALPKLRGPTHDILEWGLMTRKHMVEKLYPASPIKKDILS